MGKLGLCCRNDRWSSRLKIVFYQILKAVLETLSSDYFRTLKLRCIYKARTLIHNKSFRGRPDMYICFVLVINSSPLSECCYRVSLLFSSCLSSEISLDCKNWNRLQVFRDNVEKSGAVDQRQAFIVNS